MTKLVLIRGLPGSGKSTLARNYVKQGYLHFEADMWFVRDDGQYDFRPQLLKRAHEWCQERTDFALRHGENVVVSNTFTRLWELQPYLEMPADSVFVIKCVGNYGNVHGVPEKAIKAMKDRWENYEGEMICD